MHTTQYIVVPMYDKNIRNVLNTIKSIPFLVCFVHTYVHDILQHWNTLNVHLYIIYIYACMCVQMHMLLLVLGIGCNFQIDYQYILTD